MGKQLRRASLVMGALVSTAVLAASASASTYIRNVPSTGSGSFHAGVPGSPAFQDPEFPGGGQGADPDARSAAGGRHTTVTNRRLTRSAGLSRIVPNTAVTPSLGGLALSFDGLDHFDTRTASNGNQFSGEPPDQGLCAGNGYVMETINSAIRVYRSNGTPASGVAAFNEFYGYPPAINRTTGVFGPDVFDPSCHYDRATNRWFHVAATLEQDRTSGDFTGQGWIDLAVSKTGNPLGSWTRSGSGRPTTGPTASPTLGRGPARRRPHIGADANGFYITTNEYSFFANRYTAAQIYAFSKAQLAAGAANPRMVHIDNTHVAGTRVSPCGRRSPPATRTPAATAPSGSSARTRPPRRTEGAPTNQIAVWGLSNTASLNRRALTSCFAPTVVGVDRGYFDAAQLHSRRQGRRRSAPASTTRGCRRRSGRAAGSGSSGWKTSRRTTRRCSGLDSNDARMQQVTYAAGKLWGALDTATAVGQPGSRRAGIAYYIVRPTLSDGHVPRARWSSRATWPWPGRT